MRRETPSQTAGPFVHIGLLPDAAGVPDAFPHAIGAGPLFAPSDAHPEIVLEGAIFDGTGSPIGDALVEAWQADATGRYGGGASAGGFGRSAIGADGLYRFKAVKPGAVTQPNGAVHAPHVSLLVFARGINLGLLTRLYFPEDEAAHQNDPLLARIDPPTRRNTLFALREDPGRYRFDIHLQGEKETVFLDI